MQSIKVLVPVVLLLAACSTPKTLPLVGRVSFTDGSDPAPLAGYSVALEPVSGGEPQTAQIEADGSFFLTALPGDYRVSIAPPPPSPDGIPPKPAIDRKYARAATSGITVHFAPGEKIQIKVEPAGEGN